MAQPLLFEFFGDHLSSGQREGVIAMKTIRIMARHPLGLILGLIGLVSVAIIVCKPVALAQVGGGRAIAWGAPGDKAVPADYDGDGKPDIAVYRQGMWFIIRSSDSVQTAVGLGGGPHDIPVPADYDGDGKADIAVYRDGTWFIRRSSDGVQTAVGWGGMLADVPVPADYDGDGKADIAVYRDGTWFILPSSDGGCQPWDYGCQEPPNGACEGCWDY
jgi:hypothetical protein